ncbi:MAG: type 3 dihydrofolate reductase [Ferrimonas sp.]
MKIAMIACMAADRIIGSAGHMPWHLPADLAHFKALTLGKPVIMGRKTFESIGRLLPGRHNIVISAQPNLVIAGATVVSSIDAAFMAAGHVSELMIIGGGQLYQSVLPRADTLYLTRVDAQLAGDTQFPLWDERQWRCLSQRVHPADMDNAYDMVFQHWVREQSVPF